MSENAPTGDASDVNTLPDDLVAPVDDGACDHLPGLELPSLALPATDGSTLDLAALGGRTVVYVYPRTGRPDQALPAGWDAIPGARGCTPQSCAFRDHHAELAAHGTRVYGLSTQPSDYQREARDRLHLPFELLSDEALAFAKALELPLFEIDGMTLARRVTLIVDDGRVSTVFYPVFPPDRNAPDVLEWLEGCRTRSISCRSDTIRGWPSWRWTAVKSFHEWIAGAHGGRPCPRARSRC